MNHEDDKERRAKENKALIEKMRRGESLKTVNISSTWFPPRPIIKKNKDAINKLYKLEKDINNDQT